MAIDIIARSMAEDAIDAIGAVNETVYEISDGDGISALQPHTLYITPTLASIDDLTVLAYADSGDDGQIWHIKFLTADGTDGAAAITLPENSVYLGGTPPFAVDTWYELIITKMGSKYAVRWDEVSAT